MKIKCRYIFKPQNDQCDLFSAYENVQISKEYTIHISLKNRAKEEKIDKRNGEDKKCYYFTIDMQAIKLCPAVQASSLYYLMKLKVYNITIYNIATNKCSNYWFHEEADLDASVFDIRCSCIYFKLFYNDLLCAKPTKVLPRKKITRINKLINQQSN